MNTEIPTTPATPALERPAEHDSGEQGLSDHVKKVLENYFRDLDGHEPAHLYQLVLQEIERPLLETVMQYTRGNQSKASIVLGLNRGTLRKKLKQYDLN